MKNSNDLAIGSRPAPGDLAFVQGFVNSVDLESGRDAFSAGDGLARWLHHHGLLPPTAQVDEEERRKAVAFREALRSLILSSSGEPVDKQAVAQLQDATSDNLLRFRYEDTGELRLETNRNDVAGALATLQTVIFEAMLLGTWQRLKICLDDNCRWAFYDASKNRSGSWCSMKVCGNRTKVRKHRERSASAER